MGNPIRDRQWLIQLLPLALFRVRFLVVCLEVVGECFAQLLPLVESEPAILLSVFVFEDHRRVADFALVELDGAAERIHGQFEIVGLVAAERLGL